MARVVTIQLEVDDRGTARLAKGASDAEKAILKSAAAADTAGAAMGSLGSQILSIGIAIASSQVALEVIRNSIQFVTDSINQAIKAAERTNQLRAAIEATGNSWETAREPVDAWLNSVRLASNFTKDELSESFDTLLTLTQDVHGSIDALTAAVDAAAARGKPLATVTETIGDAIEGNNLRLKTLLPGLDKLTRKRLEEATATERVGIIVGELSDLYGGRAKESTESIATQTRQLRDLVGDLKVRVGDLALNVWNLLVPLADLRDALGGINEVIERGSWQEWMRLLSEIGVAFANTQSGEQLEAVLKAIAVHATDAAKAAADLKNSTDPKPVRDLTDAELALASGATLLSEAFEKWRAATERLQDLQRRGVKIVGGYDAAFKKLTESFFGAEAPLKKVRDPLEAILSKSPTKLLETIDALQKLKASAPDLDQKFLSDEIAKRAFQFGEAIGAIKDKIEALPTKPFASIQELLSQNVPLGPNLEGWIKNLREKLAEAQILTGEAAATMSEQLRQMFIAAQEEGIPLQAVIAANRAEILQLADAAAAAGVSVSEEFQRIANIAIKQEWIEALNAGFDQMRDNWQAFTDKIITGFAQTVGQVIVGAEDAGEAFKRFAQQATAQIIAMLTEWGIRRLIVGRLAQVAAAAENATLLAGSLATVFTNTFSSIAAIPIVGPFLAPAAAAAAVAAASAGAAGAAATGAGLSASILAGTAMAEGGIVDRGPVRAIIGEAGPEAVLPLRGPRARRAVEELGIGGGPTINIAVTVNGDNWRDSGLSNDLTRTITEAIRKAIGRGELLPLPQGAR